MRKGSYFESDYVSVVICPTINSEALPLWELFECPLYYSIVTVVIIVFLFFPPISFSTTLENGTAGGDEELIINFPDNITVM
jgi:hypothetical protein